MADRVEDLSPEKRAWLLLQLQKKQQPREAQKRVIPQLPRSEAINIFPLSTMQQRLWRLQQLDPQSCDFNNITAVRLTGPLDEAVLEKSFAELMRRHEALRTTFALEQGEPVQVVHPVTSIKLSVVDLRDKLEAEIHHLANREFHSPFDLQYGPLVRPASIKLREQLQVLLLSAHQIVCDNWSSEIFIRQLLELYTDLAAGRSPTLPEPRLQYADFASWQHQRLAGEGLASQLTYWQHQLSRQWPVLDLPTQRPRSSVLSDHCLTQWFDMPQPVAQSLKQLAHTESVTLFVVLLALYAITLYRQTGQADLIIFSSTANRRHTDLEEVIGFFSNLIVLRLDLVGNPSFRNLLARLREVVLGAYQHQEVPFEKIVEVSQLGRATAQAPLFQLMFDLQYASAELTSQAALKPTPFPLALEGGSSKFDLFLLLEDTAQGLRGALVYKAELLAADTIARLLEHFQLLAREVVRQPDLPVWRLPWVTAAEHQLLAQWNQTECDYGFAGSLLALFETQALKFPDRLALVSENGQWTYHDLNNRANRLADYLQTLGVGPESVGGLYLETSVEAVVGMLGVLKAGGAYLILDPAASADGHMPKPVQFILTRSAWQSPLPQCDIPIVWLDQAEEALSQAPALNPIDRTEPENLACMIGPAYAQPDSYQVAIERKTALSYVMAVIENLGLTPQAGLAFAQPLATDAGLTTVWPALCAGLVLHLLPAEAITQPQALIDYSQRHRLDYLKITPAQLAALQALSLPEQSLPGVHFIIQGERGHWRKIQTLPGSQGRLVLSRQSGPPETGGPVLTHRLEMESEIEVNLTTRLGRPIANTQAYVLDPYRHTVPVGIQGELCLGGQNLARGYADHPVLTSERFIPDPFSQLPGARLYQTGMRARYLLNGEIELLDSSQSLGLQGRQIECSEIEYILDQHPAVRSSYVLPYSLAEAMASRVAYFVPATESPPGVEALRSFLEAKLSTVMLPTVFVPLSAWPLTHQGEIDRVVLGQQAALYREFDLASGLPFTAAEEMISGIWQELLGAKPIGRHDNFFALGGHSLLLIQAHSKLQSAFKRELPITALFKYPTVASLAKYLGHAETRPASFQKIQAQAQRQKKAMQQRQQWVQKRKLG